jgi:hypothetical protein
MRNLILLAVCFIVPFSAFAGIDETVMKIEDAMGSLEAASGAMALIIEFVLRLIPSEKPLSFAHLGVKALRAVCKVSERIADFLDRVLPQNVKETDAE